MPDVPHPGCFASDAEINCISEINLSGPRGRNAHNGQIHSQPPRGYGVNGRRGGDAGRAERGLDAHHAELSLGYLNGNTESGSILIQGQAFHSGVAPQAFQVDQTIGNLGYIFIQSTGGRGGNGGRGGKGQRGSRGRKGANATRFSSGSNGGRGGHGGNAGNPSDGKNGGTGGDITLIVNDRDQGLLMLMKGHQAGGEIGFAGESATGGRGGEGGPGGSSYHWTETKRYTDSKGNSHSRTVFRSNPGGSRGTRGRNGAASSYRAKDGHPGNSGQLLICVENKQGAIQKYGSPYDLNLEAFDVVGEYRILEPDSLVSADHILIRNIGGMPTPPNYFIQSSLLADRWIQSDKTELVLPMSLAPGASHSFQEEGLGFRLSDVIVDAPRRQPFHLEHQVSPQCWMQSGINRPFRNFENAETILVRFPVELTEITALNSLAPGESTRVRFGITNVGNETFDDKYLHRSVRTGGRLLDGDLDWKHIAFFDESDLELDIAQRDFSTAIRNLEPGETRWIETRIGIKDDSQIVPYQSLTLGIDLHLQRPKSSQTNDQYRCVDYRQEVIRVSERYRRDDESRFLLIANQQTDVNDIESWTQLADYFGSGLDIWDVSYYGFLDLMRDVDQDYSLLQQWKGMTIIIPNNYYQTAKGKSTAFELLSREQFLRAAADYDINFYVVGDSSLKGESTLASALVPLGNEKARNQKNNQRDFLAQVKRLNKYVARASEVVGGATGDASDIADIAMGAVHEFEINKRTMLFQPSKKWLEQEARRLQSKLRKIDPLHRWMIVHRYDTGSTDTKWGFFRKRQVGRFELRRTLDSSKGSAVLYEVPAIDLNNENFITSKANKHGIFLALKFEDKVDRFIRVVSERKFPRYKEQFIDRPLSDEEVQEIGQELMDSILVDLFNEQKIARDSRVWGAGGVEALMPKLNYLAERSLNYGVTFQQMQDNDSNLQLLYRLIANIQYMAWQSKSVWDSAIFPTAFFKRSRAVSSHLMNRANRITINIFGRHFSWWDKWSSPGDDYNPFGGAKKRAPQGIERDTADERIAKIEHKLRLAKTPLSTYTTAQSHPGLTYDPEVLNEQDRVFKGEVFDLIVAKEKVSELQRAQTEYAVAKQRSELLVPLRQKTELPMNVPISLPQTRS